MFPFSKLPFTRSRYLPNGGSALMPVQRKLERDLQIEEKARAAGLRGLPEANATEPDITQRDIGLVVVEGANRALEAATGFANVARDAVVRRAPRPLDLEDVVERAQAFFNAMNIGLHELASRLVGELNTALAARNLFCDANLIGRPASYARRRWPFWLQVWLLIALESGFNALGFAGANPNGVLGAFFYTIGISVANVLLFAQFGGRVCVRALRLRSSRARLLGGLGLVGCIVGALAFQGLVMKWRAQGAAEVAYYRDVSDSAVFPNVGWSDLAGVVQQSPGTGVFGLVGLMIFALALWKFSGGDSVPWDKVWGYSSLDREVVKATEAVRERFNAYGENADRQVFRLRATTGKRLHQEERAIFEIRQIVDAITLRLQQVSAMLREWVTVGNTLLRKYRRVNCIARGFLAQPPHFDHLPAMDVFDAKLPSLEPIVAAATNAIDQHAENHRILVRAEIRIRAIAETARQAFVSALEAAKDGFSVRGAPRSLLPGV